MGLFILCQRQTAIVSRRRLRHANCGFRAHCCCFLFYCACRRTALCRLAFDHVASLCLHDGCSLKTAASGDRSLAKNQYYTRSLVHSLLLTLESYPALCIFGESLWIAAYFEIEKKKNLHTIGFLNAIDKTHRVESCVVGDHDARRVFAFAVGVSVKACNHHKSMLCEQPV